MKTEDWKELLESINRRLENFKKEMEDDIRDHHEHLTDGVPAVRVSLITSEFWRFSELIDENKEIISGLEKKLKEKPKA